MSIIIAITTILLHHNQIDDDSSVTDSVSSYTSLVKMEFVTKVHSRPLKRSREGTTHKMKAAKNEEPHTHISINPHNHSRRGVTYLWYLTTLSHSCAPSFHRSYIKTEK
jgi:UDP-N-acetylmuramyl pentapeptide phosphotransferase/UDP-N-acetylglucosamine-1-phosphate transferase